MPEPHEYVDGFRDELTRQTRPGQLPKLLVPAMVTAAALMAARRAV